MRVYDVVYNSSGYGSWMIIFKDEGDTNWTVYESDIEHADAAAAMLKGLEA